MQRKTPFLLLILISILVSNSIFGQQNRCGVDEKLRIELDANDNLINEINRAKKKIYSRLGGNISQSKGLKCIPVVFHVVWNSDKGNVEELKILEQLEVMNKVFNNLHEDLENVPQEFKNVIGSPQIEFCLAAEDPNQNPTNGIIRVYSPSINISNTDSLFQTSFGGSSAWDTKHYLNIWIVENLNTTGYAIFPWLATDEKDGVVLGAKQVFQIGELKEYNGRVAIHEIGHYLGLSHLWGDDIVFGDESCETDDGFTDTPLQSWWHYSCKRSEEDTPYSCGSRDMYMNFMDYTDDSCLNMFTKQQVEFMQVTLEEYRSGLLSGEVKCMKSSVNAEVNVIEIYPNPTRQYIKIKVEDESAIISNIQVFNVVGQLVWEDDVLLYDGIFINLSILEEGIYFIKIGDWTKKIIII